MFYLMINNEHRSMVFTILECECTYGTNGSYYGTSMYTISFRLPFKKAFLTSISWSYEFMDLILDNPLQQVHVCESVSL